MPIGSTAKGPLYGVLSPLGRAAAGSIPLASPLPDLNDKRIGFVWNIFTNGDLLARILADQLAQSFETLKFVNLPSGKKGKWGEYAHKDFSDVVREAGVDAVISVVGG